MLVSTPDGPIIEGGLLVKNNLPITAYRNVITEAVQSHSVVIIKAETGSGKSTQVPQYLLDVEVRSQVVITQPRRIAAISLAQRVAKEMSVPIGTLVGYHTATQRMDCPATRLLFCTDGLELMHKLFRHRQAQGILVLDEVHEWNLNIELLIAWTRYQIKRGADFKLVIMSATLETASLAAYYGEAKIIEVPGASFSVKIEQRGKNLLKTTTDLLNKDHNVLVFQPGKSEITRTYESLLNMDVDAEVFLLHGEMSFADQLPCFLSYDRPKCIIATNVAETSLTIPDITAVVDSGLERRTECIEGVEGLYTRAVSLADREQRRGRAGRTGPGLYFDFCPVPEEERESFPTADILRLPLEKVILQLLVAGIQVETFEFFHQPSTEKIRESKECLSHLGCIDTSGEITPIGREVASLPTSVRFGRMLIEAKARQVLPWMIPIIAIMEQGEVTRKIEEIPRDAGFYWSDVFAQLAAYRTALSFSSIECERHGFNLDILDRSKNVQEQLSLAIGHKAITSYPFAREKSLAACIYKGLSDRVYKRSLISGYKDQKGNIRNLPSHSVMTGVTQLVGLPWNFQISSEFGPKTIRLLTMATRVDPTFFN